MTVAPTNNQIIYAGGSGVYRSLDGGVSWAPFNYGLNQGMVWAILPIPAPPAVSGDQLDAQASIQRSVSRVFSVAGGQVYAYFSLDNGIPPFIKSIERVDITPTARDSVNFRFVFSESVSGVNLADFNLIIGGGLSGASITKISGSGATYTVTIKTGTGNGALRINIPTSATITDMMGNSLNNLPYNSPAYSIDKDISFISQGNNDGWILESGENTNRGGSLNSTTSTLRLGDDTAKKQYRSILSFDTSPLPDTAVITMVSLKLKRQGIVGGGNPITMFQGFMLDMRKGTFGTSPLQVTDWQANANKTFGPFTPALTGGWYSFNLTSAKAYINKLATGSGLTQIRLRFQLDDNNNAIANYLSLFSGEAGATSRPQLIIEYYIP